MCISDWSADVCSSDLALGLAAVSLTIGPAPLSTAQVVDVLLGGGDPIERAIVVDLRLPRALLALLVGGVLGLGGAAMQGYLRNPLAEPSVLGASTMAALGAVIAFSFGLALIPPLLLPLLAVAGPIIALVPLMLRARG